MYQTTASTNAPVKYRTPLNFSQTFTGPLQQDERIQRTARNDSMAKAAFAGNQRAYLGQVGKGVGAGGKMAAYRSGVTGDSEAGKAYAQAQQDWLGLLSDQQGANLGFQERQAAEQNWLRDALLSMQNTQNRERNEAYDRILGYETRMYKIRAEDKVAAANRAAMIVGSIV